MNFLQEAKYTALNVMGMPLGVRAVPKEKIKNIEGGTDAVPEDQEVWLFGQQNTWPMRPIGFEQHMRPVTLVDSRGKTTQWIEVVPSQQANQPITIFTQ